MDKINDTVPDSPYTLWRLLEHMRIAQWDILEFMRNPRWKSPKWPDEYWPTEDVNADEAMWKRSLQMFRADLEAARDIVRSPLTDFFSDLSHAPGYTVFREILLIADHNAHHLGQIILLRRQLQIWPPAG